MHFTAEMQMLPLKSKSLGEWLENCFIQKAEHWTLDCTTPCLPQTQSHQVLSPLWEQPPRTTLKATLCSSKTVKSEVTWDFPVSRALRWALKTDLHLHWSYLCFSVKVAWKQPQTHSCEFPWPSCTTVQVVAGAGRDAVVLLKSQMAAKAFLPTGASEIAYSCPRFSLGLSTLKFNIFFSAYTECCLCPTWKFRPHNWSCL